MATYSFNDAFKLMRYRCPCGHMEVIWNSRDGITPFTAVCPSCGELSLTHVAWHLDRCAPQHKLNPGQAFWRDGTPDEAKTIMRARIDSLRETWPLTPEEDRELILEVRTNGLDGYKHWPYLDRNMP